MAIYTGSKSGPTITPDGALDAEFTRLEPLLTPELLEAKFVLVPLVTGLPDPVTKKLRRITPALLQEFIIDALTDLEMEIGITISPVQKSRRFAFDEQEFRSFGYFKIPDRPVSSIEALQMVTADGVVMFTVPQEWIETGNLKWGQINILPLSPGTFTGNSIVAGGQAATVFLAALSATGQIPAYFTATYTAGWPDGKIPRVVNNLIGTEAAIRVLSALQATFQNNSESLSIDSISQSKSNAGPERYKARIDDLKEQKATKIKKLKSALGLGILTGSI